VIPGIGFHPLAIIVSALAEHFFADYWDSEDMMHEIDHLFRTGQATQIAVDDDAFEAMIYKGEQIPENPLWLLRSGAPNPKSV
jgi:hypothetical protein